MPPARVETDGKVSERPRRAIPKAIRARYATHRLALFFFLRRKPPEVGDGPVHADVCRRVRVHAFWNPNGISRFRGFGMPVSVRVSKNADSVAGLPEGERRHGFRETPRHAYGEGQTGQNLRLRAKLLEVALRGNPYILWKLVINAEIS